MNAAERALVLIAEAAAHGVTILWTQQDLCMTTHRGGWEPIPDTLTDDLDAHANEIWAILHPKRPTK